MAYRAPIHDLCVAGRREYFVEVLNDDDTHGLIVGEFYRWQDAADFYDGLVRGPARLRVVMRHGAHIYRQHIPKRLRRPTDRRD